VMLARFGWNPCYLNVIALKKGLKTER